MRKLVGFIEGLPSHSRLAKHSRNDPLSFEEHLLLSVIDGVRSVSFQTSIVAAGTIGSSEYNKVIRDAPEPVERPKIYHDAEPEEEYQFTSITELSALGIIEVNP